MCSSKSKDCRFVVAFWMRTSSLLAACVRNRSMASFSHMGPADYISQNALRGVKGYLDMCSSPQPLHLSFTEK